jgi:hypothetical protein
VKMFSVVMIIIHAAFYLIKNDQLIIVSSSQSP